VVVPKRIAALVQSPLDTTSVMKLVTSVRLFPFLLDLLEQLCLTLRVLFSRCLFFFSDHHEHEVSYFPGPRP